MISGPVPAQSNNDDRPARDQLEQLLAEINALAIRLKGVCSSREGRPLPSAVRGVLELLQRHGPMSVPALARARGTSRQNLQIIANRLTKEGWAGRATNPRHKRSELVSITANGSAMLASGQAAQTELLEKLLAATSPREVSSCLKLLQRLRQMLLGKLPVMPPERPHPKPGPLAQPVESELPVNLL